MGLLTAYSPPLYRLFCQVTGFGGTPVVKRGVELRSQGDRFPAKPLKVSFDTSQSPDLNWLIGQPQTLSLKVGEQMTAFYTAENPDNAPSSGMAVFNVTPSGVAPYVHKIACFCFEEQTLAPGERKRMRVDFYVEPRVFNEPRFKDLSIVTFSYTFFKARG